MNNLGRWEEALESLNKAVELQPDYDKAWYNIGLSLQNLNRFDEAIEAFDRATRINPD